MRPPIYHCKYTQVSPVIDGKLDDPAWQHAELVDLLRNQDGTRPRFSTVARLLWDETFLYVGYQCEDTEICATMTHRDDPLWEEEVVEIFVDANCDQISYVEIEVSPLNTLLDLFVLNRPPYPLKGLFDWNSDGIQHAVYVEGDPRRCGTEDKSWGAEIAIPWADFVTAPRVPPVAGDTWRMNLYRIDRFQGQEELYAWSPTRRETFHVPQRFGELVLVE